MKISTSPYRTRKTFILCAALLVISGIVVVLYLVKENRVDKSSKFVPDSIRRGLTTSQSTSKAINNKEHPKEVDKAMVAKLLAGNNETELKSFLEKNSVAKQDITPASNKLVSLSDRLKLLIIWHIGKLQTPEALKILKDVVLANENKDFRMQGISALQMWEGNEVTAILLGVLKSDSSAEVRESTVHALARRDLKNIEITYRLIGSQDIESDLNVKRAIISALGYRNDHLSAQSLIRILSAEEMEEMRNSAAEALQFHIDSPDTSEIIAFLEKHKSTETSKTVQSTIEETLMHLKKEIDISKHEEIIEEIPSKSE